MSSQPSDQQSDPARRPSRRTRDQILDVALELFTRHGYDGTSIRDIAEAMGMTKSALYYHFTNKESILTELLAGRRQEIGELLAWIDSQPPGDDLLQRAALHWIDTASEQRIKGMRFAHANTPVMERLAEDDNNLRVWFAPVIDRLVGADASTADRLVAQMAFDSIAAALLAATGTQARDADVLAAARAATIALTRPVTRGETASTG